jgi:hypothetical protein
LLHEPTQDAKASELCTELSGAFNRVFKEKGGRNKVVNVNFRQRLESSYTNQKRAAPFDTAPDPAG